jgi:hypothetical protein
LQIAKKNEDVCLKLSHVAKRLGDSYPIYDGLIRRRELENCGLVCTLSKFKMCPPKKRFANRCKFSVGRYKHCCMVCALLCFVCFSVGMFAEKRLQNYAIVSAIEDPLLNQLHFSLRLLHFAFQHTSLYFCPIANVSMFTLMLIEILCTNWLVQTCWGWKGYSNEERVGCLEGTVSFLTVCI